MCCFLRAQELRPLQGGRPVCEVSLPEEHAHTGHDWTCLACQALLAEPMPYIPNTAHTHVPRLWGSAQDLGSMI